MKIILFGKIMKNSKKYYFIFVAKNDFIFVAENDFFSKIILLTYFTKFDIQ